MDDLNRMNRIKLWSKEHRILSIIIGIAVLITAYWGYGKATAPSTAPRYVVSAATKGTLIVSISGSGQVSASNQVEVKSKGTGMITALAATAGAEIKEGTMIAQLDTADGISGVRDAQVNLKSAQLALRKQIVASDTTQRDLERSIRDAEVNLESAQLSLEKLKKPSDALALLQAQNGVTQAEEAQKNAQTSFITAHDSAFNSVVTTFQDLPVTITGLEDIFYDTTIVGFQQNIDWYVNQVNQYDEHVRQNKEDFSTAYQAARTKFDETFALYKTVNRSSNQTVILNILKNTYETTVLTSEAVKKGNEFLDVISDIMSQHNLAKPSAMTTHQSDLNSYVSDTNSDLTSLASATSSISNAQSTVTSTQRSFEEKKESLASLQNGADELDIKSAELTVRQRENALVDAKEKLRTNNATLDLASAKLTVEQRQNSLTDAQKELADYTIRAPFDGLIAQVAVKKGDELTANTVVATLITKQKLATISLNEVDVSKIAVGQKTTLTFDAINNLTISGEVAEVDAIGTVTQGVVTYNVKIGFDTQDDRVKPGMSVSAAIITEAKQDIVMVPVSAVKEQNGISYVEVVKDPSGVEVSTPPVPQQVQTGTSNDEMIEIISGLNEGDSVVTRTITPTTTAPPSAGLSIPGLGGNRATGAGGGGGAGTLIRR